MQVANPANKFYRTAKRIMGKQTLVVCPTNPDNPTFHFGLDRGRPYFSQDGERFGIAWNELSIGAVVSMVEWKRSN